MSCDVVRDGFMTADGIMDSPGHVSEGHPMGHRVLSNLAAADLLDRCHLLVFPNFLGTGGRTFPQARAGRRGLRLGDSAVCANGVVKLI